MRLGIWSFLGIVTLGLGLFGCESWFYYLSCSGFRVGFFFREFRFAFLESRGGFFRYLVGGEGESENLWKGFGM